MSAFIRLTRKLETRLWVEVFVNVSNIVAFGESGSGSWITTTAGTTDIWVEESPAEIMNRIQVGGGRVD